MNYQKITKTDIANGLGVRVTLWVSGCEHHCKGCHNPQTWDPASGQPFTMDTLKELIRAMSKPWIRGLTLSGGDPLHPDNLNTVFNVCRTVKEWFPDKDIWLYTGYLWEEVKDLPVMKYVNVLVDGEFIQDLKDITLDWRGSSNQRIIEVKHER